METVRRCRTLRGSLTPSEWGRFGGMGLAVVALNVAGWGIFVFAVRPHHVHYRGLGLGLGVALTAWTLGARHAFDADHISAIDNTTRKLMADGRRPLGTGFFFALGHSSILVAVGIGLAIAARAVFGAVVDPTSSYETVGGVVGTSMAAGFLYLIAALNVVVLAGILKVFRGMRRGLFDEAELERHLQARGLMYRFFGPLMRSITKTWHMYFVGLIFALGFDTATEVLLLAATAAAASQGLPWYAVLALPLLFAGGMTLFDTLDGCFMNFAYAWAFARPVRKVYYNVVITGLSIAVAFLIGTIEIVGLLSTELDIHGRFWDFMAKFNINRAGFAIAGLFVGVWAVAIGYWKLGHVEARWQPPIEPRPAE
ncbi:MAG: HoxN/HupN/NixA family nickel/cobalt transporter [Acidimicrobiales bacterium]